MCEHHLSRLVDPQQNQNRHEPPCQIQLIQIKTNIIRTETTNKQMQTYTCFYFLFVQQQEWWHFSGICFK